MKRDLRADIEHIYHSAIARVDPTSAVNSAVQAGADGLTVAGRRYALPTAGVYAITIGKAAAAMLGGLERSIGTALEGGVGVAKQQAHDVPAGITLLSGAHPVPDARSLAAGHAVRKFADNVPYGALVFCLISGGGSALVEDLRDGVNLTDLQRITAELLHNGATIQDLNVVRSRLSTLKAGGLLRLLGHTTVVNLIVSDVLGDDLQSIASGPTVSGSAHLTAESVLERYGVTARLPQLQDVNDEQPTEPQTVVVANVGAAVDAAAIAARELGYRTTVLSRSVEGEARSVGGVFGSIVADIAAGQTTLERPACVIAGGETTVTVRGDGVGGRNSEAALAATLRLSGVEDIAVGFLATDGDDGVTGAAGAIVDGATVTPNNRAAAAQALARNDSYSFLRDAGATFAPGMTGTNVNDLIIALIR